jgi:hypothetical protein
MRLKHRALFSFLLLIQLAHAEDTIVHRPIGLQETKGDDYRANVFLKKKVSNP